MKTLQISEQNALSLYGSASNEFKSMLEDSFGKSFFANVKARIKTYQDACVALGEKPVDELSLANLGLNKNDIAYIKLTQIVRALNEGWVAKVYDNENRWYPYFRHNGSSSRLCLKSEELSDYCANQFIDLWREFLI